LSRTDPVGRHLKDILEKRDAPGKQNNHEQGFAFVLEMSIPGDSHKRVGNYQKKNELQKLYGFVVHSLTTKSQ
jgi:hypothetical protein